MENSTRFLGLIPARIGSKGIKNKNMKVLDGKPLVQYTLEAALDSKLLDLTTISTDGPEILNFATRFPGIETPFLRPTRLAEDTSPTISAMRHAVHYYQANGQHFDYVVLLQPTSPFRSDGLIDRCIELIIKLNADSLATVRQIPHRFNPAWAFTRSREGLLTPPQNNPHIIPRRQELTPHYYRDGKVYITRTSLIEEGKILGGKIASLITESEPDVNIDEPADWDEAYKYMIRWKAGLRNPF